GGLHMRARPDERRRKRIEKITRHVRRLRPGGNGNAEIRRAVFLLLLRDDPAGWQREFWLRKFGRYIVAVGHFNAHAESLTGDKFAAVGVGNYFDRRGVRERVIDSFAHLLKFPQCARRGRILRVFHLVLKRRTLFARLGDGAPRARPVEFFRRHASLIQIVVGGRERILSRHRNRASERGERLRKIGRRSPPPTRGLKSI